MKGKDWAPDRHCGCSDSAGAFLVDVLPVASLFRVEVWPETRFDSLFARELVAPARDDT